MNFKNFRNEIFMNTYFFIKHTVSLMVKNIFFIFIYDSYKHIYEWF